MNSQTKMRTLSALTLALAAQLTVGMSTNGSQGIYNTTNSTTIMENGTASAFDLIIEANEKRGKNVLIELTSPNSFTFSTAYTYSLNAGLHALDAFTHRLSLSIPRRPVIVIERFIVRQPLVVWLSCFERV